MGILVVVSTIDICVTNASLMAVGVNVGASLTIIEVSGAGVSARKTAGAGVSDDKTSPTGVGVRYSPHRDGDALPTHEVAIKVTAISSPRIRFTVVR